MCAVVSCGVRARSWRHQSRLGVSLQQQQRQRPQRQQRLTGGSRLLRAPGTGATAGACPGGPTPRA
eukprot:10454650-Alexandrium_andersonii.AAC.1